MIAANGPCSLVEGGKGAQPCRREEIRQPVRLIDGHTGRYVALPPGARRVLRVHVHPPDLDHDDGLVRLRVLLVADVLRRVAEMHGIQVLAAVRHPAILDAPEAQVLRRAADALVIAPPLAYVSRAAEVSAALGGPADLHVTSHRSAYEPCLAGVWLQVGVTAQGLPNVLTLAEVLKTAQGDPLVLRLALIRRRYREPIDLSLAEIAEAEDTLVRWRCRVAEWAGYLRTRCPPMWWSKLMRP